MFTNISAGALVMVVQQFSELSVYLVYHASINPSASQPVTLIYS
jgi:hypothetical protein